MAKYIDADKLKEHIKGLPTWFEGLGIGWRSTKYPNGQFDCEDIINSIDNSPTADVVEIKHGKWIICCDGYYPYCNQCGYEPIRPLGKDDNRTPYCPNCGAKMEKEI